MFYLFGGCSKDIKGPDRINVPPTVQFVNIPVERARFSTDTTIYWYGTDIDGFIKTYRYAVVESSVVGDPETFLNQDRTDFSINPDSIEWTNIEVTLQNTGTNDRVRMSADISDPVRKYVASYVFLQAIDNLGAKSEIVYRSFLKNNHFPNTAIGINSINEPYINAISPNGILEGVKVGFSGTDPIDHRLGDEPPFEYRWKLFGPFTDSVIHIIETQYIDSVFMDNFGDLYRAGETLKVYLGLDTTIDSSVVPYDTTIDSSFNPIPVVKIKGANQFGSWNYTILGINPALDSMVLDSSHYSKFDSLTAFDNMLVDSSTFNYATEVNIYDIFRRQQLPPEADTTRQMKFVIWAQCRDDANTPDKIPAFDFFSAIDPKYERDVVVLDAGRYSRQSHQNYPVFPRAYPYSSMTEYADSFTVRNVFGDYINKWKPGSFDAVNVLPRSIRAGSPMYYDLFGCTVDYYTSVLLHRSDSAVGVTMREILKHKIVILVKDETDGSLDLESLEGSYVLDALNAGLSCWAMARAGANPGFVDNGGVPIMSDLYTQYFGVEEFHTDVWQTRTAEGITDFAPRIEDFIGAGAIIGGDFTLPDLAIDTVLLEHRYWWDYREFPFYYYPFRAPTAFDTTGIKRVDTTVTGPDTTFDTISTIPIIIDTTVTGPDTTFDTTFRLSPVVDSHTGKQCAGGYDSGYAALPEVGYLVRSFETEPLYLYQSMFNHYPGLDRPDYIRAKEGTVVAIRYSNPIFRTAYFGFTPIAFDSVSGQQMFNDMMDWLADQPYIQTGKPRASGQFNSGFSVQKYRNISDKLRELREQGLLKPGD